MIDLRSDTITQPTPEMRRAMAEAEVGDDVLGDDPTAKELEAETAEVLGKEAAVFMPSGTMTNEVAIRSHTEPGDEILIAADAHVFWYEAGGPGGLSGVMCRPLPTERGMFTPEAVRDALRPKDYHYAPTRLVCVENTSNRGGGSVWPIDLTADVAAAARGARLATHLDGARLWNASVASGTRERDYAAHFDSVSVCFSKGLGAPIGSALAGNSAFIDRARRFRKMVGGGMRQVGIISAGALYALRHHRGRLADDHANARRLAEGLADLPGIEIAPATVETNIVIFDVTRMSAADLAAKLGEAGVALLAIGRRRLRAVTSLMVDADDVECALRIFRDVCR